MIRTNWRFARGMLIVTKWKRPYGIWNSVPVRVIGDILCGHCFTTFAGRVCAMPIGSPRSWLSAQEAHPQKKNTIRLLAHAMFFNVGVSLTRNLCDHHRHPRYQQIILGLWQRILQRQWQPIHWERLSNIRNDWSVMFRRCLNLVPSKVLPLDTETVIPRTRCLPLPLTVTNKKLDALRSRG